MPSREQRRSKYALLLMGIFALWQAGTVAHFLLVPHALDSNGRVVAASSCEDHDNHGHDRKQDSPPNDDCDFLAAITHASTLAGADAVAMPALHLEASQDAPVVENRDPRGVVIYLLAPSNSPPGKLL